MNQEEIQDKLHTAELATKDLVSKLLYYDRKDDEDLTVSDIEFLIKNGNITSQDIIATFQDELEKAMESF